MKRDGRAIQTIVMIDTRSKSEGCVHVTTAVNLRHSRHVKREIQSLKIRLDKPYSVLLSALFFESIHQKS
jgi:hypothetical protein